MVIWRVACPLAKSFALVFRSSRGCLCVLGSVCTHELLQETKPAILQPQMFSRLPFKQLALQGRPSVCDPASTAVPSKDTVVCGCPLAMVRFISIGPTLELLSVTYVSDWHGLLAVSQFGRCNILSSSCQCIDVDCADLMLRRWTPGIWDDSWPSLRKTSRQLPPTAVRL